MAETKISELTLATTYTSNALFVVVTSPGANATTCRITSDGLFGNVPSVARFTANLFVANGAVFEANTLIINRKETPSVSSITVKRGTVLYDDNYIYIATANNLLKRAALSSF